MIFNSNDLEAAPPHTSRRKAMLENKQCHGCLTVWLVLMIVANSLTALVYLFGSDMLKQSLPTAPGWTFPALAVLCAFNLTCSIALFKWQKWGLLGAFWRRAS
jgi:hypothetical protein